MTDNLDDFDNDFDEATVQRAPQAAPKPGMAGNLKAAWHGSPLFKLFILVIGVGALAAAVIGVLSGGGDQRKNGVNVGDTPGITAIPGTAAVPEYNNAVKDASQQRADEAIKANTSALPTPVGNDANLNGLGNNTPAPGYDQLTEFKGATPQDNTSLPNGQPQQPVEAVDADLLGKMQNQMTAMFDSWKPEGVRLVQVVDPGSLAKAETAVATTGAAAPARVLVPAGTIAYAQLMMEANSDAPGPILAEVMSGPFTGARAIGTFEVTREYLILHFTKLSYHKKDYQIDALAIDPNTTLGALVTEKDNRYFTRVILPSAAAFLEGFGSAIGSSPTTIVNSNGDAIVLQSTRQGVKEGIYRGISESANTVGGFLRDEAAATKPLIRVATGTPMGLFFVNSMTDDSTNGQPIQTPIAAQPGLVNSVVSAPNATGVLNATGTGIPGGAQSSLANSGVSVIQTTPRAPTTVITPR